MQITGISSKFNKNNAPIAPQKNAAFGSITHAVDSFVSKNKVLKNIVNNLEFDGCNMSVAALYTVIMGGIILPRFVQAREENERKEIVFRDTISVATVVFAFKMLENIFSKVSSVISGYALAIKPKDHNTLGRKVWNYIKPVTGVHALSGSEIVSKYSHLQGYKDGLTGFMEFVDRQGGDIKKMFGKTDKSALNLLQETYDRTKYSRLVSFKDAKNKDIIVSMREAMAHKSEYVDKLYKLFEGPKNSFAKKAHTMNSRFSFLSIFIIVPWLLGWSIPKANERFTKEREMAKFTAQTKQAGVVSDAEAGNKSAKTKTGKISNEKQAILAVPYHLFLFQTGAERHSRQAAQARNG